jgi:hypothetical protein
MLGLPDGLPLVRCHGIGLERVIRAPNAVPEPRHHLSLILQLNYADRLDEVAFADFLHE